LTVVREIAMGQIEGKPVVVKKILKGVELKGLGQEFSLMLLKAKK
jgi:hypothetical protein